MISRVLVAILPGISDYMESLELQKRLHLLRQKNLIEDVLLLLEHPPIITLGKSAKAANILGTEEVLKAQSVSVYQSDRGGDVTYHGPGQVVGYPILSIKDNNIGVKQYIWLLEQLFIELLQNQYFITADRDPKNRGVWVEGQKIVAIGCAIKQRVTMHGFAFNVNTNLDHFKLINPCGIMDKGVISLKALSGCHQDLLRAMRLTVDYFGYTFKKQTQIISAKQLEEIAGDGQNASKEA